MITIVGRRGTGKTEKLLQQAREKNAMILTVNARALRVKANSLGYNDIEIIGFGNLKNDDYSIVKPTLVDNCDEVLSKLLDMYYRIDVQGVSLTTEN